MTEDNEERVNRPLNYPGNTHKQKGKHQNLPPEREDKKVESVVTGNVVRRKKSAWRRVGDAFTGDDARNTGAYVVYDIAIPALKTMLSDMVSNGVERMLFGEVRPRSSDRRGRPRDYVDYNKKYEPRIRDRDREMISNRARKVHDFAEIILDTRGEAEEVLDHMSDLIDKFDVVTVSDLYDLLGETSDSSFVDEKWGWTDIRSARAVPVRDGYRLDLPKTEPID